MKIGIVTVYYTENCGSVLQATELSDKLKKMGHEVYFISTRNKYSGHSKQRLIKSCLKNLIKFRDIKPVIKKYKDYDYYIHSQFNSINLKDISQLDYIIIGSDTVWDITSKYFNKSKKIFWMTATPQIPIITYAASIANSGYDQLNSLPYVRTAIDSYRAVSVRDMYTYDYVKKYTEKDPIMVCDPTLLHDKTHYISKCKKLDEEKYMLLYLFNNPNECIINQIKEIAKNKKLKIIAMVCLGKRIAFADKCIESTIENFLSYFNQAECVITNTFHGTVFSVIFNKKFITLDYNKVKINEFLEQISLNNHLSTNVESDLLYEKIDYTKVNNNLNKYRKNAEEFLESFVGGDTIV